MTATRCPASLSNIALVIPVIPPPMIATSISTSCVIEWYRAREPITFQIEDVMGNLQGRLRKNGADLLGEDRMHDLFPALASVAFCDMWQLWRQSLASLMHYQMERGKNYEVIHPKYRVATFVK